MKKNRLFWRMFWAFLAVMLVTALTLSLMMVVMVRGERVNALENELRMQARDVAKLMQQYNVTLSSFWQSGSSVAEILNWKIGEIRGTYSADVWLVSSNRRVLVLGDNQYDQEQLNDEDVLYKIDQVLSGDEIRVQGLIKELGPHMVTIGVPWRDITGRVGGAVLLHISTELLVVDYLDLVRNAVIAVLAAMAVGAVLAFVIARLQTEPIRQIRLAVTDFAKGKLERRVMVSADQELMELAASFNQMAQDLSNLEQSRRSFVANVSHELRSPLTSIRGYIEGLLDGTIGESERGKYLNVALFETKRLTKLVNELLDLSKIESGNLTQTVTRFDLSEILRQELIKFEGRIDEKGLNVEVDLPDEPLFAWADCDRVRQIATNLIDNAIKFARTKIMLTARDGGAWLTVTVENDGEAIAGEDLPHLFDRFYTADKAHTSGKGTGLGLAIVKKILDQMGQKIWVESDEQKTSFHFTLEKANGIKEMRNQP